MNENMFLQKSVNKLDFSPWGADHLKEFIKLLKNHCETRYENQSTVICGHVENGWYLNKQYTQ